MSAPLKLNRPEAEIAPVTEAPMPVPAKAPTANYDDLHGLKVLIVDDMPSNQDVIKLFLEPEGCEMLCAANRIGGSRCSQDASG